MIVFGTELMSDRNLGSGRGMTSKLRGREIRSWKQSEPSSLLAREYAAALMRVTLGVSVGLTGGTDFGSSRTESGRFGRGADDRSVSTEGDVLDSCCDGAGKRCCQYQSIEGL